MVFNPIIQLVLAVISGVVGIFSLNATESWLSLIPCLFFVVLFFVSLALPGMTGTFARRETLPVRQRRTGPSTRPARMIEQTTDNRSSTAPFTRLEKLTPERLRSHSQPPLGVVEEAARLRPSDSATPHTATISARSY